MPENWRSRVMTFRILHCVLAEKKRSLRLNKPVEQGSDKTIGDDSEHLLKNNDSLDRNLYALVSPLLSERLFIKFIATQHTRTV